MSNKQSPQSKQSTQNNSASSNKHDLPPKRQGKAIQRVHWPLMNTDLSKIVYYISAAGLLVTVFYVYRIMQWKSDVGGWWNLALGKRPSLMRQDQNTMSGSGGSMGSGDDAMRNVVQMGKSPEMDLEFHISAIASILDIRPTDLAFALSDAVHSYVAPKTLSSLSSSASAENAEKTAVEAFFGGDEEINDIAPGAAMKLGKMAKAVEAFVGSEEPIQAAE